MGEFSKYPDQIDSSTELPKTTDNITPVNAEVVNRLRDAILMIESELGIQPSSTYGTVRARLDAMEAGSGGGGFGTGLIEILYNNVTVDNQITDINFTGNVNVVVSQPHRVTVEIGTANAQKQETLAVLTLGQTSFTLTEQPAQSNAVEMFVNGVKQKYGTDYTISGTNVTYSGSVTLLTTDTVEFWYLTTVPFLGNLTGIVTQLDGVDIELSTQVFNFTEGIGAVQTTQGIVEITLAQTITSVKTGTYTADFGEIVRCDPSGGGFTINLPTASGSAGKSLIIKNVSSSLNSISIQADGVETIDGTNTQTANSAWASYYLVSDGAGWMIV